MANQKISQFSVISSLAGADYFPVVQDSDTSNKRVSLTQLLSSIPAGSAASPSIAFIGDSNTGIYSPGADRVAISTNGTQRILIEDDGDINIDSGGVFYDATNNRLAIGTTSPSETLEVAGNAILDTNNATLRIKQGVTGTTGVIDFTFNTESTSYGSLNLDYDQRATQGLRLSTVYPLTLECGGAEEVIFKRSTTETARIDSSGRLLVGTSSAIDGTLIQGVSTGAAGINLGRNAVLGSGDDVGNISFFSNPGSWQQTAKISVQADGAHALGDVPGRIILSTTPSGSATPVERMRINQDGRSRYFSSSSTVLELSSASSAGTTDFIVVGKYSAAGVGTGNSCVFIYSNGDLANTNNVYGAISDVKLKENIVDASSQWNDLKALQVRNYNFKEGQTHTQIGLIAQEVELVSPGLVSESPDRDAEGNDLGTVTKSVNYSVLYMKAVKALQEAMERIETLEAKVNALEGN